MVNRTTRHQYYFYLMASRSRALYAGVTNDLVRRVSEHKQKLMPGFTARYNISRLVYFETYSDVREAIAREKQAKGWLRTRKVDLIESINPNWRDLSTEWLQDSGGVQCPSRRVRE